MSCLEEKPTEEDLEFMRQVCEELSDAVDVIVKRLDLPDNKVVHVIKFEEKPFVVRSEISALLWDADLLRSMVSYFLLASPVMIYGCYRRKVFFVTKLIKRVKISTLNVYFTAEKC